MCQWEGTTIAWRFTVGLMANVGLKTDRLQREIHQVLPSWKLQQPSRVREAPAALTCSHVLGHSLGNSVPLWDLRDDGHPGTRLTT